MGNFIFGRTGTEAVRADEAQANVNAANFMRQNAINADYAFRTNQLEDARGFQRAQLDRQMSQDAFNQAQQQYQFNSQLDVQRDRNRILSETDAFDRRSLDQEGQAARKTKLYNDTVDNEGRALASQIAEIMPAMQSAQARRTAGLGELDRLGALALRNGARATRDGTGFEGGTLPANFNAALDKARAEFMAAEEELKPISSRLKASESQARKFDFTIGADKISHAPTGKSFGVQFAAPTPSGPVGAARPPVTSVRMGPDGNFIWGVNAPSQPQTAPPAPQPAQPQTAPPAPPAPQPPEITQEGDWIRRTGRAAGRAATQVDEWRNEYGPESMSPFRGKGVFGLIRAGSEAARDFFWRDPEGSPARAALERDREQAAQDRYGDNTWTPPPRRPR